MSSQPAAFLTYVRFDDEHENGRLTELCKRLGGEIRVQTGAPFRIFQDRSDIAWGQQWKERIDESLDAVTFLVAVITPGFFRSAECRKELDRFLAREKDLGRGDLILPVYYVNTPALNDETKRKNDPLMQVIASRQYADWRDMRFEPWTSPQVGKSIAAMALQIAEALDRPIVQATPATSTPLQQPGTPQPQLAPKIEPPTRIVDPLHRGHHATVTEALRAAKPGDRILVRPGLYAESIVIEKPVEIVGDGDRSDIVIESQTAPAISFRSTMGRVSNLTLRRGSGGSPHFCVDISQGRVDLEDCDISSQSLSVVGIHTGADPRLRRNLIHNGNEGGVYIYENGRGTLEDNDIFSNALNGVEIRQGSDPMVRRNRIHRNKQGGIVVYESGRGTIEENDIFANELAGLVIKTGGNPAVRRNKIRDGKEAGVFAHTEGQGTLEENEIVGNSNSGIIVETDGNPTARRNRISGNGLHGVFVREDGRGVFERNDLRDNRKGPWRIEEAALPNVTRNGNQE